MAEIATERLDTGEGCDPENAAALLDLAGPQERLQAVERILQAVATIGRTW